MRVPTAVLGVAAVLLAGCVSEPVVKEGERIRIPPRTGAALKAFVDEPVTVLADEIVVDLSRDPFLAWSSFNGSAPNAKREDTVFVPDQVVTRTEVVDEANEMFMVTIENISGVVTTEDALPLAAIGDGLRLMATKRILLRYHMRVNQARPAHLKAVADGSAVILRAVGESKRRAGSRVVVSADVIPSTDGYRFDKKVEVVP
jgi:hypothetical protein